ncbi:MAG TPA: hypothetical protein DE045_11725 [Oceanospirillaceae bacterium]|nr:hypothetical protein [Oceanospirillaceae bacterium]
MQDAINTFQQHPKINAICYSNYRRALIKRFPYGIFYTIEPNQIVIHAVFPNRQKPNKRP